MVEFASFLLFNDHTRAARRVIMHIHSVKKCAMNIQIDESILTTGEKEKVSAQYAQKEEWEERK